MYSSNIVAIYMPYEIYIYIHVKIWHRYITFINVFIEIYILDWKRKPQITEPKLSEDKAQKGNKITPAVQPANKNKMNRIATPLIAQNWLQVA